MLLSGSSWQWSPITLDHSSRVVTNAKFIVQVHECQVVCQKNQMNHEKSPGIHSGTSCANVPQLLQFILLMGFSAHCSVFITLAAELYHKYCQEENLCHDSMHSMTPDSTGNQAAKQSCLDAGTIFTTPASHTDKSSSNGHLSFCSGTLSLPFGRFSNMIWLLACTERFRLIN